jgi:hypothetical protein
MIHWFNDAKQVGKTLIKMWREKLRFLLYQNLSENNRTYKNEPQIARITPILPLPMSSPEPRLDEADLADLRGFFSGFIRSICVLFSFA